MKKPLPCGECTKPILESANYPVWELFQDISSQARIAGLGGFVGYDYSGLETLLRIHHFPEEDWFLVLDKLRAITSVTQKIVKRQQEEQRAAQAAKASQHKRKH